jgi:hypothetical protein
VPDAGLPRNLGMKPQEPYRRVDADTLPARRMAASGNQK